VKTPDNESDAGSESAKVKTSRIALINSLSGIFPVEPEEDYAWVIHKLEHKFPGLKITRIYGMYPTQMDGKYNELGVYARYRWGNFSIIMGEDNGADKLPSSDWAYEKELKNDSRGVPIESEGFLDSSNFYEAFQEGFTKLLIGD
jgi:hypothetical protein